MLAEAQPLQAVTDVSAASAAAANTKLNQLEAAMAAHPRVECPLVHRFTPGLYIREIFMPAGTFLTSKIHNTEHPFVITKGSVSVYIDGVGVQRLGAGHIGITKPGTRRVLFIHEDTVWMTFHPTKETDLAAIERELIFEHDFPHEITGDPAELLRLVAAQ